MSLLEEDLISALKELYTTSKAMTSGRLPSADETQQYLHALLWAERVINSAERDNDRS